MSPTDRARVLVIDPAFLGDVVFDGPLVRALEDRHEGCSVGLVVRPPADQIARRMCGVDRVHVFDKRGVDSGLGGLRRCAEELRSERYDIAYLPHPSLRSALLAWMAGIPRRIASRSTRLVGWFYTEIHPRHPGDTFVQARLRLVGDGYARDPRFTAIQGTIRDSARISINAPLDERRRLRVGLVLGSAWATKRWSIDQAARFVEGAAQENVDLVLVGHETERHLYAEVDGRIPGILSRAEDAVGETVEAMIRRLETCDLVVAGDTGPLHLARALGVPVIALFGPTSETMHDFAGQDCVLALDSLECRPCSAHGDRLCPLVHHACMRQLGAEHVLEAVRTFRARRLEAS